MSDSRPTHLPNRRPRGIYLDYQATTPTDPRVVEVMLPWFTEQFGNPHSDAHAYGWDAEEAVERARGQVAASLNADAREIVFTSGATESNNLAIKGAARFRRSHEGRNRVVTLETEHKCVLESTRALAREGFETEILPVRPDGLVDLDRLGAALDERTALVSVMAVNNEIGVIQPLPAIAERVHAAGAWLHVDAAQAVGKVPLDVVTAGIDLLSLSGHKLYGPKGVGALYVRRRPRVRLEPLFDGGGQERGLRSGTLPTPLCVGLGEACSLASAEREAEASRLEGLRQAFLAAIEAKLGPIAANGSLEARIPGNLNLCFPGAPADKIMAAARGLAVSTGSACSSAAVEPSYVLRALGLSDADAACSLRIGFGRMTTAEEVGRAADLLAAAVVAVRAAAAAAE
ncbi:cysteine desulfurase family protein [Algihabitans albus]|uniref:cysteine desulfurase family protein n=1 Tax=Algihabitans albus TaxID=2164067 RepID=UPI000E5D006A|nr:aminotransferase class V-fold PLP-dependent enzyme [Algihabitans albus]